MRQSAPVGNITFELLDTEDGVTLKSIYAIPTPTMPAIRVGCRITELSFELEDTDTRIPDLNSGRSKIVKLTDKEELNEDLMYLPLVLHSKADLQSINSIVQQQ